MSPRWIHRLTHWTGPAPDCLFCRQRLSRQRHARRQAAKRAAEEVVMGRAP